MLPVMGALHPLGPETRGQWALAALTPVHCPKPLLVSEGQFFDRDRFLAAEAHTFGGTATPGPVRNGATGRLRPDRQGFADPHGIRQMACFQSFSEGGHLT